MRAAVHTEFGAPEVVLSAQDQPLPEPASGQVRIKTILSPIHNHDLWTIHGNYGYKPTFPAIAGSEAVGIIDAVGENVSHVKAGQRIAVAGVHGTWAEYFLAPANLVVPLPNEVPDDIAAQLIAMPLSAAMLLDFLQVTKGDWLIQNAASGAVGKVLAILAQTRGVNTISLVRRDTAINELKALGVQHVVSTEQSDWQAQVKSLLGNHTIRAAVDSIGGSASKDLVGLLGESGTLVSFGSMNGEPMQIPTGDVIFKQVTVKGFWGSKVSQALSADDKKRLLTELIQGAIKGALKLPVEGVYVLADIKQAVVHSLKPAKNGKILIKP